MKTSYLLIAIFLCNVIGLLSAARWLKTLMLALSAGLALLALLRLLG